MLTEIQKRACVETLIASGLSADQAQIAVDLADHTVRSTRETFMGRLRLAPNVAVGMAATQIAAQLAMQSFQRIVSLSLSQQFAGDAPVRKIHLSEVDPIEVQTAAQEAAQ